MTFFERMTYRCILFPLLGFQSLSNLLTDLRIISLSLLTIIHHTRVSLIAMEPGWTGTTTYLDITSDLLQIIFSLGRQFPL
jgi:hypothetical protein